MSGASLILRGGVAARVAEMYDLPTPNQGLLPRWDVVALQDC